MPSNSRLLSLAAAVAVCLSGAVSLPCFAQFTAAKVTFRNAAPYKDADLQQVAGLHTGEKTSRAGIQAAAQHLMDSGYFADVQVDSKGTPAAMEIIFLLKPESLDNGTPVGFENFVWLTPEELQATLHKGAPLFAGKIPEAGTQLDAITAALQAALTTKGVAGATVTHEVVLPTTALPVHAFQLRVDGPATRIHSITLTGGLQQFAAQENTLQTKLRGTPYAAGFAPAATADFLLAPYRNAGYLDARLDNVRTTATPAAGGSVDVDLTADVVAGEPYRVGAIQFAGTPLISAAAFNAGAKLHAGDVASRSLLLQTLAVVDLAYHRTGYMDEYADTGVAVDATAHTVSYTVTAVPGEQYRLRSVRPVGLSPEARAQFGLAWTMKPGDLYNADYVSHFIENNSALRALATYAATFEAAADSNTHEVDLTVKFVPSGVPMRR